MKPVLVGEDKLRACAPRDPELNMLLKHEASLTAAMAAETAAVPAFESADEWALVSVTKSLDTCLPLEASSAEDHGEGNPKAAEGDFLLLMPPDMEVPLDEYVTAEAVTEDALTAARDNASSESTSVCVATSATNRREPMFAQFMVGVSIFANVGSGIGTTSSSECNAASNSR